MTDKHGRFIIEDYNKKPTFASFLPAVCGEGGVPMWCFYVNRGQAVCSLGCGDKEHSVMEFSPALYAYRNTALNGFRTFLRVDGKFCEAFCLDKGKSNMYIGKNELELEWKATELDIAVNVLYYIMPDESIPCLVRTVTVKSLSKCEHEIELVDGCPAIVPYGMPLTELKHRGQTMSAWMCTKYEAKNVPFFTLRADIRDSTRLNEVSGGSFYFATDGVSNLPGLQDYESVF